MTTRTYALVMTILSIVGIVAMLVAMAALDKERQAVAQEFAGENIKLMPVENGLPLMGEVIDFALHNQSGTMTQLSDLDGKIWVADFIFTSCVGVCPKMSKSVATLQRAFKDTSDIRFVSITVDPETDTPEVLANYAQKYEADFDRWSFLTGTEDDIRKLANDGFMLGFGDEMLNHSAKFALVDRKGNLRGFYTGTDSEEVARLRADIEILLSL